MVERPADELRARPDTELGAMLVHVARDGHHGISDRRGQMPRSTSDLIRHAEELADLVESDKVNLERASPEVTQAYKELLAAVIERGKAEEDVTRAIAKLRRAGGSWNLIGPALGVSRQSAREKYALVDDGD